MQRKRNNQIGRRIYRVNTTIDFTSPLFAPLGLPLFVRGEADGKDSYDFSITVTSVGAVNTGACILKYAGIPNGHIFQLRDLKQLVNTTVLAAAAGDYSLEISPGSGCSLKYSYAL